MDSKQAEALAARIFAAMDGNADACSCTDCPEVTAYAREQVSSDLAGLRERRLDGYGEPVAWSSPDAERYASGLRRTAALYGVTP